MDTHPSFTALTLFLALPILLYCFYSLFSLYSRPPPKPQGPIPSVLWTYHRDPNPTQQQQHALDTWRRHHPTWRIHVLTPDTVHGYLHGLPDWQNAGLLRAPALWEDLVALHVIYEHGGVWLESTTALHQPIQLPEKEVAVVPLRPHSLIRRHAFAGQRRSPFFRHWRDEYLRLLQYPSVTHYLQSIFTITPLDNLSPEEHVTALALEHSLLKDPFPPESIATEGVFRLS
jgi:hypothetical protein